MNDRKRVGSSLHLQMGQETLYLLLTSAIFASIVLAAHVLHERARYEDPPIITLPETAGFSFPTGSAELSDAFKLKLRREIAPRLREMSSKYDAHIIEVIGHTDEVPLSPQTKRGANLDTTLLPLLLGKPTKAPVPADNIGLGMARAIAVSRALKEAGIDRGFTVAPLSAGPYLRPDDTVTDGHTAIADKSRRRIEIRLRRPSRR